MSNYINRELQDHIIKYFKGVHPKGMILTGIVGCGKSTLLEYVKEFLKKDFEIFSYSGGDAQFRQKVIEDTNYLWNSVKRRTTKRSMIFVDEVQKIEEVFDSIKIAFDVGLCSFIVSGSNPEYLSTTAKKRLQRRADQIFMLPFSLCEVLSDKRLASLDLEKEFQKILWEVESLNKIKIPQLSFSEKIKEIIEEYFVFGGLPLSFLAETNIEKLREIRMTVERGFDLISSDNNSTADVVRKELALLQSQEFAYKHILDKTRLRQRSIINECIDKLINHGYLSKRRLFHFEKDKSSYLTIFSFIDPGIVSYLTGKYQYEQVKGFQTEGYVHSRLNYLIQNDPRVAEVNYYKEYAFDSRGNLRYLKADVDFIFIQGTRIIPIECKAGLEVKTRELEPLKRFIEKTKVPFGIVLYAGVPQVLIKEKLVFWPYWLL